MRLFLLLLIFAACTGCDRHRTPSRYEIPKGYKGWLFIVWECPKAAALPVDKNRVVIRFPKDGLVQTSSAKPDGWATDEFYWVLPNGALQFLGQTGSPQINGDGGGTNNIGTTRQIKFSYFYVGEDYSPSMTPEESLEIALQKAGIEG